MPEPTVVQSIADNRIVSAADKHATAQTTTSVAQTQIAAASNQIAAGLSRMADNDNLPYSDFSVWLTLAASRSRHPNAVTASLPEVAAYADKALLAFKQRFPRPVLLDAAPNAAAPGYLPELNVSLFKPVTEAPKP